MLEMCRERQLRGVEMQSNSAGAYKKRFRRVLGREMAYIEVGQGDPIIFLHGNPSSSYIWRTVLPALENLGRCIAPDLLGMGDSSKLADEEAPQGYHFFEHRKYLDRLLEELGVEERVTFVLHDWGAALGFDWAYRHPEAIKGLVYMEAIVGPYRWEEYPEVGRKTFQALRSDQGETMVLEQNSFVEFNLPRTIIRSLSQEEHDEYRRPYLQAGEARRAMLSWARQLPVDGEPAEIHAMVAQYGAWLAQSSLPKLFIRADPGMMQPSQLAFCRTWPNQVEIPLPGLHNLQEDSGPAIGQAIAAWLLELERGAA
jgi:haloalkane dehalogenase